LRLFDRTLGGNQRVMPGTQLFVDTWFYFSGQTDDEPQYLDVFYLTFNQTDKTGEAEKLTGVNTPGGRAPRRKFQTILLLRRLQVLEVEAEGVEVVAIASVLHGPQHRLESLTYRLTIRTLTTAKKMRRTKLLRLRL
jgi:hypothetical protein